MASWLLSGFMIAFVGPSPDCTILHFTADWCQPCKQMAPDIERLRSDGWNIQSVDVDRDRDRRSVEHFQVKNLPTLVIVSGGREVDRMVGASSYDVISRRASRAAARMGSGSRQPAPVAQNQPAAQAPQSTGPIVRGQSMSASGLPAMANRAAGSLLQSAAQIMPSSAPPAMANSMASTQVAPRLTPQQAVARAQAATVRIRVDEPNTTAFGTGTIIDVHGSEALVLTCGHLFRHMTPGSQLTIDLYTQAGMQTLPARLIDFKADAEDVGLISFATPIGLTPVDLLPRGEKPITGQPAFSFGCDHGENPTLRETQVTQIDRYLGAPNIEIHGAPAVGRSGGGLFDMQGRLIGVCNAADETDNEGIYAAADVVYSQISRLGLDHLFQSPSPPAVQFASASTPLPRAPAANAPGHSHVAAPVTGQWPTQDEIQSTLELAASAGPPANAAQLICIVRDANGVERRVTVDRPTPQLLSAIERNATQR